jgi:charged multivesicular body protein 4
VLNIAIAAKAALRRKKQFEHLQEQTSAQIMTLEGQIHSIETANINKETLDAMKNAGSAMKQIHAGMDVDAVDNVMYVLPHFPPSAAYTDS